MVKFRKMLVENKGFTLIELLVVIAVLGILAAIAIPRLTGVTDKARNAEFESTGGTIRSAMEMYRTENADYPGGDNDELGSTKPTTYTALDGVLDTVELPDLAGFDETSTTGFSYALGTTAGNEYEITLVNTATGTDGTTFVITEHGVSTTE